jgi:argininosuccinate lyase
VSENSVDAVSDRDFIVEFLAAGANTMAHLSRMAEELIWWSSPEFNFVRIRDEFTSGSSIMPQKRNPDTLEIIRGDTGRVFGSLMTLLTLLKGLPLAYNRDLQEDKPPLFDALDTLVACITIMAPLVQTLQINGDRMRKLCEKGYLAATELADHLAERGVPFRSAHGIVARIVQDCRHQGVPFESLTLGDLKKYHPLFDRQAIVVLSPAEAVKAKISYGGTSLTSVERQLKKLAALTR